jgi:hypothetical protein
MEKLNRQVQFMIHSKRALDVVVGIMDTFKDLFSSKGLKRVTMFIIDVSVKYTIQASYKNKN